MKDGFDLVIGLGLSGRSVIRYLTDQEMPVRALDTRDAPAGLDQLRADFPNLKIHTGGFKKGWLEKARRLIVSPGVAISTPAIAEQVVAGKEVIGDIELFARAASEPVVAITGSNAKSTVTTLLGQVAEACSMSPGIGGNLGVPALELLDDRARLYVLELSSFQLETTYSLSADVATILNVSQDHLDRYASFADYVAAKQRIYDGCQVAVWNRDDLATRPSVAVPRQISFGTHPESDYRLDGDNGLLLCRGEPLLRLDELALTGRHNAMNILAVMAMSDALGLNRDKALATVKAFTGLPHRCQMVAEAGGVRWFNDSKATNVGATLAALTGIGESIDGKVILVAGGQGKGQDFSPLAEPARQYLRAALLMGEDRQALAEGMSAAPCELVTDMAAAVARAHALAQPGDAVLLSPACASFDMYSGFAARGDDFTTRAREVCDG
ncbi:UDP-N-acetylmuramoylalanine--D-glutamate ligase [Alcanivorax hongdengensis A-11-3]|uniref:UDP-N-acetylmuramoylalanine--D-glutamate ligase n=1 Tax=Alcanivorax hongdengensis A-11-3 TaxID=1177179 RepID=L0WBC0_9GAMM|nr:UDP-N-acetylmuramoyl-L-alanine--D-glutamate ligase [Alcanivorax hongdengensis]EKF74266.1 UDP-N-acetylmuramoylalanine--D-glutamate ligase [Alcanivorax hongdengensis A-11-3]